MTASLRFYYFPFSCSLASHISLEESGLNYERTLVNIMGGQHRKTEFMQINPKGAVPALGIDGELLTENQAILTWIADQAPEKKLIPSVGSMLRYRAHEWMNFCAATLHPHVRSVFRSVVYAGDNAEAQHAVGVQGRLNLAKACEIVERKLPEQGWALGEDFSVVDAYLLIIYIWSRNERMGQMPDRPKWLKLARKTIERPAVERVIEIEAGDRPDVHLGID